jgi:hypothetical protein
MSKAVEFVPAVLHEAQVSSQPGQRPERTRLGMQWLKRKLVGFVTFSILGKKRDSFWGVLGALVQVQDSWRSAGVWVEPTDEWSAVPLKQPSI